MTKSASNGKSKPTKRTPSATSNPQKPPVDDKVPPISKKLSENINNDAIRNLIREIVRG